MKDELKIENIILNEKNCNNIELNLKKDIKNSLVNNISRIEIRAFGNIYTKEKENDNKNIFKELVNLKDKYLEIKINFDGYEYKIKKMYIYELNQKFENGSSTFNLIMYQRFMGEEKEMILIEDKYK